MAFTRWLSEKIGQTVTLPTEMQWQRAAQGDDERGYPWGNEFDPAKCNTSESGFKKTTSVDQYPEGASPFGVLDMAGNVREWCLNEYGDPLNVSGTGEGTRVLRGGSWSRSYRSARAAFHRGNIPGNRSGAVGFRLVRASVFNK